jgi:glycosyltransferase involved in cell wall biosynthesis
MIAALGGATGQTFSAVRCKTVCLAMIVKNEAAVIARCLRSVKPFISAWVICDTGSTDETCEIIESELFGIPGEIYKDRWISFEHNRTLSVRRAADKADYTLLLDADMVLKVEAEFRHKLELDQYLFRNEGANDYSVERLLKNEHQWRFVGVTHEYVVSDSAKPGEILPNVTILHHEDGGSRGDKYERDVRLLTEEINMDPNNARAVFYLAQSYRDLGSYTEALRWYFQRAGMGGWDEEVWYSLYMIGWMQEQIGAQWPVCLAAYLQAFQFRPTRLEPVYRIAKFYREHKQYTLALLFARLSREIPYPEDHLFIDRRVYEELLPIEYAICCKELGFSSAA